MHNAVSLLIMITRKDMEYALKEECIPLLRELGFKGSFPNFYRNKNGFISLINFQFFSSGESFCINLSYADSDRKNIYFRPDTEAKKLTVSQTTDRIRLGSENGDRWFSYGITNYGEYRGTPISPSDIIVTVNNLIKTQAEQWWLLKQEYYKSS